MIKLPFTLNKEPGIVIFTAPSGAGKTTIVRHLLSTFKELGFSVSATNRPARPHEVDGKDYYFYRTREFLREVKSGSFLEWEEVYDDQFYGTLGSEVDRIWSNNKHILFDIEVNGASNLKEKYGERALAVFIKPPSKEILFQRLKKRKTETEASLKKRIARAGKELTFEDKFDYVLLNDDLATAFREAEAIVEAFLGITKTRETSE